MAEKSAEVRFYVDADLLGLAKVLVQVRSDVTYPGDPGGSVYRRRRPPCMITETRTKDPVWIPVVAAAGWLIITRDRHIQDRSAEMSSVRDNSAKMVALSGDQAKGTFTQLEVLMNRWRGIEALAGDSGPFIYTATRTTLRPVDLGS